MPHRDRAIILAFVVVLAVLAGGILLPAARPAAIQVATPSPSATPEAHRPSPIATASWAGPRR